MNKYIIKNLIIGICALYFVSCSDFLDRNPLDQISSPTFWQSEAEADMALAGVYARLYAGNFIFHYLHNYDAMGGNVTVTSGEVVGVLQGTILPTSGGLVSSIFSNCYQGIASCNFFLDNIERTPISTEKLNIYMAEVRFLRAFFYFRLTEHYGGVPLYTSPVTVEEAMIEQSTKAEVIAQVISDLDFAIANLPNTSYRGHAVKGSALALKARVLLHQEQWQEAATAANQVIQDGVFSLYDNYRDLFLTRGQSGNPEIIFSTRHAFPDRTHWHDIQWAWWGVVGPQQDMVDAYECTDGLPITSSPLYDPSEWKLNRDPRLLMTVKHEDDSVYNSAGVKMGFDYNDASPSGFRAVKYCNWDELPIDYSTLSDSDVIHLRYADVLLMYAEARNEAVGPDASVYDAINAVRARPGVDMPPIPAGLTQNEMRERIRNERRVEFGLEGLRWSDVKRWRIAEHIIPTLNDWGTPRTFDPNKNYLLPFPQTEIDINPNLKQNPNY